MRALIPLMCLGGLSLVGVPGCCFGPSAPAPPTSAPPPPPTPEEAQAQVEASLEQHTTAAREEVIPPEEHLRLAEVVAGAEEPPAPHVAQARGHLDALPDGFEPARVRTAHRALARHETRLGRESIALARTNLRNGDTSAARMALASIPAGSPVERDRASVLRQIEQREQREARALAARGPLTELEAQGAVIVDLQSRALVPDSVDVSDCGRLWHDDTQWMIDCVHSQTNAFGVEVTSASRFYIRQYVVTRSTRVSGIRR